MAFLIVSSHLLIMVLSFKHEIDGLATFSLTNHGKFSILTIAMPIDIPYEWKAASINRLINWQKN